MKFSIFQDSRVGGRAYNQDRIGYLYTRDSLIMVLADGMGGHLLGEVAAQIALEQFMGDFQREARTRIADPDGFLYHGVGRVQNSILRYARDNNLPDTPRTTLVACIVQDGHAWWTHIGDSRLYLVRKGRIVARTRDHTRVQQLVDEGRILEEAVSSHPERNRLLQALGGMQGPRVEPTATARLARDDIVLLCSDGFWGPLTQRQFLSALLTKDIMQAVPELMTLAESRAGAECDNVSVVAMCWGEEEASGIDPLAAVTLPFHELPTDVQDFTATDPEFGRQPMSDEDIERAIEDIRLALKKHHPPRK